MLELCLQGLLHISDMSWDQVGMPEDVVTPGDVLQLKIKGVDKAKRRIYFSLKLMEVSHQAMLMSTSLTCPLVCIEHKHRSDQHASQAVLQRPLCTASGKHFAAAVTFTVTVVPDRCQMRGWSHACIYLLTAVAPHDVACCRTTLLLRR